MKAICTYCAKPKRTDSRDLPAVRRYLSERIDRLHAQAQSSGHVFFILSGKYGFISAGELIPWYDHLLNADEVAAMAPTMAAVLNRLGITDLTYHTADSAQFPLVKPYLAVVQQACQMANIPLQLVTLPGNPD